MSTHSLGGLDYRISGPNATHQIAGSRTSALDGISYLLIVALLICNSLHHVVSEVFPWYCESIGGILALTCVCYILQRGRVAALNRTEVLIVCAWIVYYFICYLFDPQISDLYGDDVFGASKLVTEDTRELYVLRRFFIHLPIFFTLVLRGINYREFAFLLLVVLIVSLFGVQSLYGTYGIHSFSEVQAYCESGRGVSYNQFSPFLSFLVALGVYGTLTHRLPLTARLTCLAIASLYTVLIILSRSKAAVIYVGMILLMLNLIKFRWKSVLCVLFATVWFLFFAGQESFISERYLSAQSYSDEDGSGKRLEIMREGLDMVEGHEWIIGKGFSCVVLSGPHNNYIRVLQRTGILGVLLTFSPFVVALLAVKRKNKQQSDSDPYMPWLVAVLLLFPLYHSLFSYPHEEAWNTACVWFGLGLATCYLRGTLGSPRDAG